MIPFLIPNARPADEILTQDEREGHGAIEDDSDDEDEEKVER